MVCVLIILYTMGFLIAAGARLSQSWVQNNPSWNDLLIPLVWPVAAAGLVRRTGFPSAPPGDTVGAAPPSRPAEPLPDVKRHRSVGQ